MHRRNFLGQTSAALAAAMFTESLSFSKGPAEKQRVAMVGTGDRGTSMWGTPVVEEFKDIVEFVGLCDINPGRVETAKKLLGVSCPTYTDFDKMMKEVKPARLIVTTVDATHSQFIIKGMEYGADIITEKP